MSGVGLPQFDPVLLTDAKTPTVAVQVRTHTFDPSLMVVSLMCEGGDTTIAALDPDTAAVLARAITGWLAAESIATGGHLRGSRSGGDSA